MFKALMENFAWKKSKKTVKKITLGICAMDKKAKSKPMREILQRLPEELFTIVYFGDECILDQPIESWPVVEVLISFFSKGFPTSKALEYVKLRKPYMINDLEMEATLSDRRKVYNMLKSQNIDVPRHVIMSREDPNNIDVLEEFDEWIIVNGEQINKPFVEKPFDANDHNIYIYYPSSAGGGSKRLFRKVEDRSSEFYPGINEVRREGSFIYEEFVNTQGSDVKVYTVGPEYGHAEARKSPVIDGRVKRDSDGLEVRFPVILSHVEKDIARKVVTAFRQTVCGFDILRVKGKSYCCDVNGFSFVKNSRKYYEDASQILTEIMLNALRPEYNSTLSTRAPLVRPVLTKEKLNMLGRTSRISIGQNLDALGSPAAVPSPNNANNLSANPLTGGGVAGEDAMSVSDFNDAYSTVSGMPSGPNLGRKFEQEELRCVVAVIRHGDRTPKQKMKLKVTEQKYLDYFHSYAKSPRKELKVKSKSGLVKFLEVTREILAEGTVSADPELRRKLCQIRDVLERWEISGINRKLQFKPQKWASDDSSPSAEGSSTTDEASSGLATEVILILKWGGDLTPLGRQQAEQLGTEFRHNFYPDTEGGGVLRLHATYRHDLKIKASDEGRVMKTAAAFTKGLLELEGQLTPILASLVTVEDNRQMLDRGGNFEIEEDMDRCKAHLDIMQVDAEMTEELVQQLAPNCSAALRKALFSLGNPLQSLHRLHGLIGQLCVQLEAYVVAEDESTGTSLAPSPQQFMHANSKDSVYNMNSAPAPMTSTTPTPLQTNTSFYNLTDSEKRTRASSMDTSDPSAVMRELPTVPEPVFTGLYLAETPSLMLDRWEKLHKDFYSSKTKMFDLTKVPDVYDMIRYDILHNSHLHLLGMEDLFQLSRAFETSVVPQEYGTDNDDKRYIGSKMCSALLEKIRYDIKVGQENESDDMHYTLDHSHAEDLRINSLGRCVRTRLYFTSESHLHTLLNVLRYPSPGNNPVICKEGLEALDNIAELSYLTQIVFRLFEDRSDPNRFHCEISLSPGATNDPVTDKSNAISPYVTLNKSFNCQHLLDCLESAISLSREEAQSGDESCSSRVEEGTGLAPAPITPAGHHLTPHPHDHWRNDGIRVLMDELASTSDKWERGTDKLGVGKDKGDKKKKKKSKLPSGTLPPIAPHPPSTGEVNGLRSRAGSSIATVVESGTNADGVAATASSLSEVVVSAAEVSDAEAAAMEVTLVSSPPTETAEVCAADIVLCPDSAQTDDVETKEGEEVAPSSSHSPQQEQLTEDNK